MKARDHSHAPDIQLLITIGILLIFGLVMLSSASSVISFERYGDSNGMLKRQLLYGVLVGMAGFLVMYKISYQTWRKYAFALLLANIALLVAVFIPGIGYAYGGARRWLELGPTLLQPSELLKLTFTIYLATLFAKNKEGIKDAAYGLFPFLLMLGIITVLIMFQPDMGTMITIASIGIAIFYIAGAPYKHLAAIVAGAIAMFFLLIKLAPYRAARLTVFLNPELDPQGIGYHINQALLAIGSGGIFGQGLGHSRQKYLYLPEVTGDSIFAIVAEELGLVFSVLLIVLFIMLLSRGFSIARRAPDAYGRLLAIGITCWLVIQAFINIAAMVTLVPLTGIPLPFISYGSSALAAALIGIGLLANISKHTKQS